MTLPADYLSYPRRRRGMDQSWWAWRDHGRVPRVRWPNDARVAVWISVSLEFFPLNPSGRPFRAPGSMVTPYPDLRHFTTRDYGNRVAAYRILSLLDRAGVRASFAVNSALLARCPDLIGAVRAGNHEIIAHGIDMDRLHHGGLERDQEAAQIDECLDAFEHSIGRQPRGWLSPARSQSAHTLELLARRGVEYVGDFLNDELPYPLHTPAGALTAMPLSMELSDRLLLAEAHHSEDEYVTQVIDQLDWLARESEQLGGRILSLSLTPYVIGLPYRIRSLSEVLSALGARKGLWFATGAEILDAWRAQTGAA